MNKRTIGAIQVFLAALCWSFSGVFSKWLPWSAFTILGMRSFTAVLALGLTRKSFKVRMSKGNILGALGMCITCVLFLSAMNLTSAANAIVLQYAMPVVVIGLCWLVFKQKPTIKDVVTSVFVLCGVILCSWKGLTEGGGSKAFNPFYYILNAYGFLGQSSTNGEKITMREGKPVIPANDPVFKEALATMKTYYEEGLISQDYFTLDSVSVNGMLAEGKLGTYGQKVGYTMANYDDFSHWIAVKPLTS